MITLDEFVQQFASQFDETEPSVFTPETKFRELDEWSSLLGLSVISLIDECFGLALTAKDFRQAATISELYQLVQEKIG